MQKHTCRYLQQLVMAQANRNRELEAQIGALRTPDTSPPSAHHNGPLPSINGNPSVPRSLFYTTNYTTSDQASGNMRLVHWQKARVMMSTWKQRAAQRLNGAASGTAQVLGKTYALKKRVWKSHDALCASWGVRARTKYFHYSTRSYFFSLMRRRRCRCTTSASHVVRLSLRVPLFISSSLLSQ
jgi:hypothetical protein